LRWIRNI